MSTQIRHMLKENVSYKKMCIVCARRWNNFRCENKCDWDFFLFVSAASLSLAYVVFIIIIIHFHFHYLIKIPVSWLKKECVCVLPAPWSRRLIFPCCQRRIYEVIWIWVCVSSMNRLSFFCYFKYSLYIFKAFFKCISFGKYNSAIYIILR